MTSFTLRSASPLEVLGTDLDVSRELPVIDAINVLLDVLGTAALGDDSHPTVYVPAEADLCRRCRLSDILRDHLPHSIHMLTRVNKHQRMPAWIHPRQPNFSQPTVSRI